MNLYNDYHPATKSIPYSTLILKLMVLLLALTTGVVGQYQSQTFYGMYIGGCFIVAGCIKSKT